VPLPVVGEPVSTWARLTGRWVPESLRGIRLDPGRRGAVVLALVAVAAAMVAAIGVWRDQPVVQQPPPLVSVLDPERTSGVSRPMSPPAPSAVTGAALGAPLVVSVVGKVRHPGLVSVPAGSRVADAIGKAGGPLPGADLSTLNLARRLGDGEQIPVGLPASALPPDIAPTPGAPAPAGPLDLNRATVEQLDALPGVGPVTARRILDWRTAHGGFSSVDQLREIPGIGERKFSQLKDLVTK
jgi:competence protein ComEA